MSVHWVPKAGNRWWRVNTPGLEAFEGFLLTTCFWEQGLLFHDNTAFTVSPKLCHGLGGRNCILCLNTLMFIWNGYVQVSLMLYSLKIIKLHNWIINFASQLEAVPECPFQNVVLWALHMSSSNCCFLTCIQISQEAGQVVWHSHFSQNFPQFIVIHTVKGFGIVYKAEIDVFWNSLCFSMIQQMLAIWSLVPLPFLKPAWTSGILVSWFK